jgi:hypothetical protein
MAIKKNLIVPLAVLAVVAIALTAVSAGILISQNISATGTIQTVDGNTGGGGSGGSSGGGSGGGGVSSTVNLEVYSDALATSKCSSIEWGSLSPGGSVSRTVYIKNTGDTAVSLSIAATTWNPVSAGSVLTLSWNKEGAVLAAGAIVTATLTLNAAPDTGSLSSFSLNIVVSGST